MAREYKIILLVFIQMITSFEQIATLQITSIGHYNASNPTTTIQHLETYSNGCYRQLITEPDHFNATRLLQTEQLICPPNVNITMIQPATMQPNNSTPMAMFPAPSAPPAPSIPGVVQHYPNVMNISHNVTYLPTNSYVPSYVKPAQHASIPQPPPPAQPFAPYPAVMPQPKTNPAAAALPSNVLVLSQNTLSHVHNLKKSSANSLNNFNCIFVLGIIIVVGFFN